MIFFEVGRAGNNFWSGPENPDSQGGRLPLPESTSPEKFVGGGECNVLRVPQAFLISRGGL